MTPEVITATAGLGQYGAIGISILSIIAIVVIVYATFKFNASQSQLNREAIAEQSQLNRSAHKENTGVMTSALKEVSSIVGKFATESRLEHLELKGEIREIKTKLK